MKKFLIRRHIAGRDCDGATNYTDATKSVSVDELETMLGRALMSYGSVSVEDYTSEATQIEYREFSFHQNTDEGYRPLSITVWEDQ